VALKGGGASYAMPSPQHKFPWATGPGSVHKLPPTCFADYNHYTGEHL